jgi:hypothetical protein
MYEKFMELKEKKKWLFWLLIIPFLFVAALEFYNRYLVNSGKKIVKDTEKEDAKLKAQQDKFNKEADAHKDEADKIEENIKKIEVDEDWHKK